jgi:hypothetical protein
MQSINSRINTDLYNVQSIIDPHGFVHLLCLCLGEYALLQSTSEFYARKIFKDIFVYVENVG